MVATGYSNNFSRQNHQKDQQNTFQFMFNFLKLGVSGLQTSNSAWWTNFKNDVSFAQTRITCFLRCFKKPRQVCVIGAQLWLFDLLTTDRRWRLVEPKALPLGSDEKMQRAVGMNWSLLNLLTERFLFFWSLLSISQKSVLTGSCSFNLRHLTEKTSARTFGWRLLPWHSPGRP